jgi:hypothetical protein
MERIESESFRLLCPELANALEGSQASKTLQALREVVSVEERGEMRAQAGMRLVVEPADRGVLMVRFIRSTWPFVHGWLNLVRRWSMPSWAQARSKA